MTITSKQSWAGFVGAAAVLLGLSNAANASPIPLCTPLGIETPFSDSTISHELCVYTRNVDFWFGTLTVEGVASSNLEFFQSTDPIPNVLGLNLQADPGIDVRVTQGMQPFVDSTVGIEWVLANVLENLPAEQNLLSAYVAAAAALDGLFGPGTLTFGGTTSAEANYVLASAAFLCEPWNIGCVAGEFITDQEYRAQINMFAQNAVWRLDSFETPLPVPEPATIALVSLGLGAAAPVVARRRRQKTQQKP